jgi:hypothetical protein
MCPLHVPTVKWLRQSCALGSAWDIGERCESPVWAADLDIQINGASPVHKALIRLASNKFINACYLHRIQYFLFAVFGLYFSINNNS